MSLHREMLIDGHFIGGPCDQAIGKAVIKDPFDASTIGTAAEGSFLELRTAIDAAHSAFNLWRREPRHLRQALLRKVAAAVRDRRTELADLLVREIGKPVVWAEGEVDRLALTFEASADALSDWGQSSIPLDYDPRGQGYECHVERFPVGVVFGIVPYNWPYNLAAHKIAPALAVGNTLVIKPSPQALLCTYSLVRLIHECGCPPGVINVVEAPPADVERALQDPRIAMISFTGSEAVGWAIKAKAPVGAKVVLELGGDAPAVVMPDADLDWATKRIVAGGYGYAGQICISIQHVWIHRSIAERATELLAEGTRTCKAGDPKDRETVCGPLISDAAASRVQSWIDEAVSGGARLLAGGSRSGNIIAPTLLGDVPANCKISIEEVFGPVLTVRVFDEIGEAISGINGSRFGIQAGIFTRHEGIARRFYEEVETGGVIVNDYPTLRFDTFPYGGVKRSGFGREGVRSTMNEMSEPKTRVIRNL